MKYLGDPSDTNEFSINLTIPQYDSVEKIWYGLNAPIRMAGAKTVVTVYIENIASGTYHSNNYSLLINEKDDVFEGHIISLKIIDDSTSGTITKLFNRDECIYFPGKSIFILNIFDRYYVSSYNLINYTKELKVDSRFTNIEVNPENPIIGKTFDFSSVLTTEFGKPLPNVKVTCQYRGDIDNSWVEISSHDTDSTGSTLFEINTKTIRFVDNLTLRLSWLGNGSVSSSQEEVLVPTVFLANQVSLFFHLEENPIIYRNCNSTLSLTLINMGNSTLKITNIGFMIDGNLNYSIREINYLLLNHLTPGASTKIIIEIEVPNVEFDIFNITVSISFQNVISTEIFTVKSELSMMILDLLITEFFIEYFIVFILAIIALIWVLSFNFAKKTIKKIEMPLREPTKARVIAGKYVKVSELEPRVVEKELEPSRKLEEEREWIKDLPEEVRSQILAKEGEIAKIKEDYAEKESHARKEVEEEFSSKLDGIELKLGVEKKKLKEAIEKTGSWTSSKKELTNTVKNLKKELDALIKTKSKALNSRLKEISKEKKLKIKEIGIDVADKEEELKKIENEFLEAESIAKKEINEKYDSQVEGIESKLSVKQQNYEKAIEKTSNWITSKKNLNNSVRSMEKELETVNKKKEKALNARLKDLNKGLATKIKAVNLTIESILKAFALEEKEKKVVEAKKEKERLKKADKKKPKEVKAKKTTDLDALLKEKDFVKKKKKLLKETPETRPKEVKEKRIELKEVKRKKEKIKKAEKKTTTDFDALLYEKGLLDEKRKLSEEKVKIKPRKVEKKKPKEVKAKKTTDLDALLEEKELDEEKKVDTRKKSRTAGKKGKAKKDVKREEAFNIEEFKKMTVKELRVYCKEKNIIIHSSAKKFQLIQKIKEHHEESS